MGPKELEKVIEEVKLKKRNEELENMNEMVKERLKAVKYEKYEHCVECNPPPILDRP